METTWDRVLAWRLRRHYLADAGAPSAVAVARRVVGLQAQVPSCAAAAAAVRGVPATELDRALAGGELVRTWAMRGTLHLLAVADAPSVLALLASARTWERPGWQREFATADEIAGLTAEAGRVLDGVALTREELAEALGHVVAPERLTSGWGPLLKPLAWQGVLVNGPPRGNRPTFTTPHGLPGWTPPPDVDAAARHVITAYLGAYGPASPETFDAWLLRGVTPRRRLRGWFAALVEDGTLTHVDVEGETLHARTADLDDLVGAAPVPGVRLLPGFDPYVLGPGTTDARVVPPAHRAEVSRAAGWIAPVVLVDGRVVGTWSATDEPTVTLFDDAAAPDGAELTAELARVGRL